MLNNPLYTLARLVLLLYAGLMLKLSIRRLGLLPAGPKIFVSNHPSATDPFMIHIISPERLNVLITAKAFSVPVFGWFLRTIREIPVPLEQSGTALEEANQYLREGKSVAIFIEGHISPPDGSFLPPRTGAARLAVQTGVPVIPVGIFLRRELSLCIKSKISGNQVQAHWCLRGPYAMTVGQPMQFAGDVEDRQHVRNVSEAIMRQIRLLAGESEHRTLHPELAAVSI
ncbi:MAG TPA: lysophospholipid acyltransferase family protein [Anaerolineales bacterium]|nr:lysophospholipid acyltransferase family protein [Anaerolineales bacterium]